MSEYSYNDTGNRLTSLSGSSSGNYTYDATGNMTHDGLHNLDLTYNRLNLLEKISQNGTTLAKYTYLSDGTKLSATDAAGNGLVYQGSFTYKKTAGTSRTETIGDITLAFSQSEDENGNLSLQTFGTIDRNGVISAYDSESGAIGRILGEKGLESNNTIFDVLFIGKGLINVLVKNALRTTAHGTARIAGAAATRGGVLSAAEVSITKTAGVRLIQADGAVVYICKTTSGKFNIAIEGSRGLITTFKNISQKSVDRLTKNYGWH